MKKIKMMVYGEAGVGKSVFALGFEKPFFITTDGNYEWLEDFGATEDAHKQVYSWSECKDAFNQDYDGYDTIVLDLIEDAFKWCEQEFCQKNKIDHIGDLGFGKGYDITRNEFFLEICKLIAKDKNIILLSHSETNIIKDRRGVEHTMYKPSSRIPDKLLDRIEGRLRYVLRAYLKGEEEDDGYIIKKRYLSLVPKENEYGIIRGIDENKAPQDIPLNAKEFLIIINNDTLKSTENVIEKVVKKEEPKKIEVKSKTKVEVKPKTEPVKLNDLPSEDEREAVKFVEEIKKVEKPKKVEPKKVEELKKDTTLTNDKLKELKAKLAKLKGEN